MLETMASVKVKPQLAATVLWTMMRNGIVILEILLASAVAVFGKHTCLHALLVGR